MLTITWEMPNGYFISRQGESVDEVYKGLSWQVKRKLSTGGVRISVVNVVEFNFDEIEHNYNNKDM